MTQTPDFRPDLAAAQQWVAGLLEGVRSDQLEDPTPCTEYDVRGLIEHISALPAKLTTVAEGGHPLDLPTQVDIDADRFAEDYRAGARSAMDAWADDSLLTRTVNAPWGEAPGALAAGGFLMETVTHGWDLAVATAQDAEANPELVDKAHAIAEQALPDEARGAGLPFGPRVEPSAGAGPTERFAAFMGRAWPTGT